MARKLTEGDLYEINKTIITAEHYSKQYPKGSVSPPPVDGLAIHVEYEGEQITSISLSEAPNQGIQEEIK